MRTVLNSYGPKDYDIESTSLIFSNNELINIEKAIEALHRQYKYEIDNNISTKEYENTEDTVTKYVIINNTIYECNITVINLQFLISKCKILINQEERCTTFTFIDLLTIYLGIETISNGLHKQHFTNSLMQTRLVDLYDKSLDMYNKLKHEIYEVLSKSDIKTQKYGYFTTTEELLNKPLKYGELPIL